MTSQGHRQGFSMLELMIAIVLLAIGGAGLMGSLSREMAASNDVEDIGIATQLAQEIMEEVRLKGFDDPDGGSTYGPETGETRATYDDVDDYDELSNSPPLDIDGTPYDGAGSTPNDARFTRAVIVVNVPVDDFDTATPLSDSTTQDHAKRITVTVSWGVTGGTSQVELQGVVSKYQPDPE